MGKGLILRRLGCGAGVLACVLAPAAWAAPADDLRAAFEDVPGASAYRYGATDDRGLGLDGLKVIEADGRYLGVHHSWVPTHSRFEVSVATSDDLLQWSHAATLDSDAAQPTIAALPGGGYVVAYELGRPALLSPSREVDQLLAPAAPVQRLGRATVRLRFRRYPSREALLAGRHDREFTAPLTLSPTAEGTPSIVSADSSGGAAGLRIEVGLHYFADENGDSYPDVDRQATGVLTGFLRWEATAAAQLNAAFLGLQRFHTGFSKPPAGHIGDRDHVTVDGARLDVHEAQYRRNDFLTWRPFLVDPPAPAPEPLEVRTHAGSRAFGNPTVTALTSPAGKPALFVSLFVFSEGAAPSESGPLLYYREREP
jgi:hypothetical protein